MKFVQSSLPAAGGTNHKFPRPPKLSAYARSATIKETKSVNHNIPHQLCQLILLRWVGVAEPFNPQLRASGRRARYKRNPIDAKLCTEFKLCSPRSERLRSSIFTSRLFKVRFNYRLGFQLVQVQVGHESWRLPFSSLENFGQGRTIRLKVTCVATTKVLCDI